MSGTQNAFVPRRLITNNVFVTYKLIHYFKYKGLGKQGYMYMKLDICKAYDRVEWGFFGKNNTKVKLY